jgi:hypothetical protein
MKGILNKVLERVSAVCGVYTYEQYQRDLADEKITFNTIWERCGGKIPRKAPPASFTKPTFEYPNAPHQGDKASFPDGFEGTIKTKHEWILNFRVQSGIYVWGHKVGDMNCLDLDSKEYYTKLLAGTWPRASFKGPFRVGLPMRSTMGGNIAIVTQVGTITMDVRYPQKGVGTTCGHELMNPTLCELALPRKGEVWEWKKCYHNHQPGIFSLDHDWRGSDVEVLCGCLMPSNFGKGALGLALMNVLSWL